MANPLGFFGKFFGSTISEAVGYGIGSALEKPLEPPLQELTNETWRAAVAAGATVPLDPDAAAEIVAEDVELEGWGADQAAQTGIGGAQFAALVQAVLNAPGMGELLQILRRNPDQTALFAHGLRKTRLETRWDKYVADLANVKLSPQQIAVGMVRSVIDGTGFVVKQLDTSDSNVKQYPIYPHDAVKEAADSGINPDQLRVMVGEVGLPMAAIAAAQAFFRGILTKGAYYQAILEGDTRPEWADSILDYARQIPTAHDFIEMRLRNYFTSDQQLYDATARHGMSEADTDVLFEVTGRPLSFHQVFIGHRRGGTLGGAIGDIDADFLDSLRKSNIRPEYYNLAWAQRYTYPSAFVLKALTSAGDLTSAQAEEILLFEGWEPALAKQAADAWGGPAAAPKPKKLTNATIRSAWKKKNITEAQALQDLIANGLSPEDAGIYLLS